MIEKTLQSFAKLNLCLEVGRLRPDGYHEVESIMTAISLSDSVTIRRTDAGITVRCDSDEVPRDEGNIAWKAARLFLNEFSLDSGIEIDIKKNIPVGAGLGGGSSNAAAVLKGMPEIFGILPGKELLLELAAIIGSDVPFFIDGGVALARGRGEILSPVKPLPEMWFALVDAGFQVSTAWAYAEAEKIGLTATGGFNNMLQEGIECEDIGAICRCLRNSLEDVVVRSYPIVRKLEHLMISLGALGSAMSGSGPSVFGVFKSRESAAEAVERLNTLGLFGWVVRPV